MDLTIFLAQIMGVYILVSGLSGLLHGERIQKALTEATRSYVIPYFDGAIALSRTNRRVDTQYLDRVSGNSRHAYWVGNPYRRFCDASFAPRNTCVICTEIFV